MFLDISEPQVNQSDDMDFYLDINLADPSTVCRALNNSKHIIRSFTMYNDDFLIGFNNHDNNDLYIKLRNSKSSSLHNDDIYKMTNVLFNGYNCSLNQDKVSFMFTTKGNSDAYHQTHGEYKITNNDQLVQALYVDDETLKNIKVGKINHDNSKYIFKSKYDNGCDKQLEQCMLIAKRMCEPYKMNPKCNSIDELLEKCEKKFFACKRNVQ